MKEVYNKIVGYENIYEISNLGNVRSLDRYVGKRLLTGKIIKQALEINGYLVVTLHKNGNKKTYKVHRLVAKCFIDNPKNKRCVNHKDFDKTNNTIDNLEWNTHLENVMYSVNRNRLKFQKPIVITNKKTTEKIKFPSQRQASVYMGFHIDYIADCVRRNKWENTKYRWEAE